MEEECERMKRKKRTRKEGNEKENKEKMVEDKMNERMMGRIKKKDREWEIECERRRK